MKNKIMYTLIVAISFMIILSGCGPSKDIVSVMSAIDAIGEVKIDSASVIDAAEAAYNSLPEKKQLSVTNHDTLVQARNQLNILKAEAAIDAIGEVTINSGTAIESAEKAYNALSNIQQQSIGNYKILQESKKRFIFIKVGTTVCQGNDYFVFSKDRMTIEKIGQPHALKDFGNTKLSELERKNTAYIYKELEIPNSVCKKIGNTTMLDGTKTETCGNINVTWSFDPTRDNHLYLLFEYKKSQ